MLYFDTHVQKFEAMGTHNIRIIHSRMDLVSLFPYTSTLKSNTLLHVLYSWLSSKKSNYILTCSQKFEAMGTHNIRIIHSRMDLFSLVPYRSTMRSKYFAACTL